MISLGGTIFTYNCESQDYSFLEAIDCLRALCDQVIVVDAGSTDKTTDELKKIDRGNCRVIYLDGSEWKAQQGREKLNYFTNKAIEQLDTEYQINLQADECIYESSFPYIREAIETGQEGFLNRRWNFWKDPYHILNVPQNRKPCSTEIIRLTKTQYRSVGDAESIDCQASYDFISKIEMAHLGYVRKRDVMKRKVIHMLEEVFLTPHDKRLDVADEFRPMDYFSEEDLISAPKPLPIFVRHWAEERMKLLQE